MSLDVRDLLAPAAPGKADLPLAPDVVFHSPVADYSGRDDVAHLFPKLGQCLTGIEPVQEFTEDGGRHSVTTFHGSVRDETVYGAFVQEVDDQGRLTEATLLIRPLSTLRTAVSLMREALTADPLPSSR
ncbi:nuclear transport factor 2 family protein [Streptomyces sp. NPDC050439]|uniref:nuclear transport factor 2 family protein n=1 Tax=unclassified Streptomyces TaxID=2593676 RepID=UPI00343791CB